MCLCTASSGVCACSHTRHHGAGHTGAGQLCCLAAASVLLFGRLPSSQVQAVFTTVVAHVLTVRMIDLLLSEEMQKMHHRSVRLHPLGNTAGWPVTHGAVAAPGSPDCGVGVHPFGRRTGCAFCRAACIFAGAAAAGGCVYNDFIPDSSSCLHGCNNRSAALQ